MMVNSSPRQTRMSLISTTALMLAASLAGRPPQPRDVTTCRVPLGYVPRWAQGGRPASRYPERVYAFRVLRRGPALLRSGSVGQRVVRNRCAQPGSVACIHKRIARSDAYRCYTIGCRFRLTVIANSFDLLPRIGASHCRPWTTRAQAALRLHWVLIELVLEYCRHAKRLTNSH